MNPEGYPRRKEQVIAQRASSDFLLFNMDDGNYYSLDEVGCRIWELCDGTHSIAQLIEMLAGEYDAPKEVLAGDVLELLEKLRSARLLIELDQTRPHSPVAG